MAVQDIYLSPGSIIKHLRMIEKAVHRTHFELYVPLEMPDGELTDEMICVQAQRMFEFADLRGYTVLARFVELPNDIGGRILITEGNIVQISISEHYKKNKKATLAILAHELCHKVLSVSNLSVSDSLLEETLTDLTTIYLGFGKLILEGYNTYSGILGYLTPDTYKNTHLMVCAVYGLIPMSDCGFRSSDIFIEDAISMWETFEAKSQIPEKLYLKQGQRYHSLYRDIARMKQILNHIQVGLTYSLAQGSDDFFSGADNSNGYDNKLSAFALIYNLCIAEQGSKDVCLSASMSSIQDIITKATYDIFVKYQETTPFAFSNDMSCPFCGERMLVHNSDIHVDICPKCKKHIIVDCSPWNPTVIQREINEEKKRQEMVFKLNVDNCVEKKTLEIRNQTERDIEEVRYLEHNRCKEEIRRTLPKLLRPLFNRYIK